MDYRILINYFFFKKYYNYVKLFYINIKLEYEPIINNVRDEPHIFA